MRTLSHLDGIAFAELLDLCQDTAPASSYKANGSFLKQNRGGRDYWYYRGYERSSNGAPGRATLEYAGVVGDPELELVVAEHARRHSRHKTGQELASRLRRSGLPAPRAVEGSIVAAIADAGLFAEGSVMVGSAAFQTFGGLLGIKLDESTYRTQDIDVAQPAGLRIGAAMPAIDMFEVLKRTDPSFTPLFVAADPELVAGFRNADNFKVEFLTPQRREKRSSGRLAEVAGLAGVGAQQLKYLEFLLADPVPSVVLHDAGVLVSVPVPMRYAIHKLIVSVMRGSPDAPAGSSAKAFKDVVQAERLIEASRHARTGGALGGAWIDAWNRGPSWRKLLREGTLKLGPSYLAMLADSATEAAVIEGVDCPFFDGLDPRTALLKTAQTRRSKPS